MKKLTLLLSIVLATISCFGQIDKNLSYEELETKAISSFRNNHTDSSIIIMEYAHKKFPDEFARTSNILAYIYTRTNNLTKAIEIWKIGMNKGYIFDLNNPYYQEYYKDNADFEALAQIEKSRLDTMHVKYEIVLPTAYNNKKTYPILFVFHGNNRNIEKSKISWNAPIMEREFITVFLQSYIPSSPTDFNWVPKDEKIKKEFTEIYNQILKNYPANESKIIFAGMSAGGRKALEFTLNNDFPATGLVLNCPVIPENVTDDMITQFVAKNKKLGIITGEKDFALEGQKKLVSTIDSLAGQTKMFVTKDLGHSFAENFTKLLDEYLSWVIETEQNFLETKDAYFGLTPPGIIPEVFAPNIVSTGMSEINACFSPDYTEFLFSVVMPSSQFVIMSIKYDGQQWSAPEVAGFSGEYSEADPFITSDGKWLYYVSKRPIDSSQTPKKDWDIWRVENINGEWGKPEHLESDINSNKDDIYPSLTKDGTLYFSSGREGRNNRDIYFAKSNGSDFEPCVKLNDTINKYWEGDIYISPDEDYMIFKTYGRPTGNGLYITFNNNGKWSIPQNMGEEINKTGDELCPMVDPDGKYFFFTSNYIMPKNELDKKLTYQKIIDDFINSYKHPCMGKNDIYWVSIDIIENYRNNH